MKQNKESIFKSIGLTSKILGVYINEKMSEHGMDLTQNQYTLLKILMEKEGSTQNDLADLTERDKTSMARLVNIMESKRLISKVQGKVDRRKRRIYLTDEGKKVLQKALPIMQKIEAELIKDLSPREVQSTIELLNNVQAKVLGQTRVLT